MIFRFGNGGVINYLFLLAIDRQRQGNLRPVFSFNGK